MTGPAPMRPPGGVPTPAFQTPTVNCHLQAQIDAKLPHPEKKKIFVFCDGTGNEFAQDRESGGSNSNVVKVYTTVRITNKQVAYYHPGVGTMGDPAIRNPILNFWSKVKGLAFGYGFKDNVLDAYRYLMEVYNDGDDIYIFGFSRGAYTARALGGMLHGYGLLCRGNEGHITYAWNMFHDEVKKTRERLKKDPGKRGQKSAHTIAHNYAFAQTFSRKVKIRFMGIWDTVSSVGWIYDPVRLLDMAQNPIVQVGRHAVSIDERRAFFRDNLWGPPVKMSDPEWPEELREQNIQQDLAQVWFPGVHSDVGGSYSQTGTAPANEALRWMIGELQQQGAELCQDRVDMVLGTPSGVYAADVIYTPPPEDDHEFHNSLSGFWLVLQGFPQQYYDKDDGKIQWRVPYGTPRKIPLGSIIHGSAIRRMTNTASKEPPYKPRNLKVEQCKPLTGPHNGTTANLEGCYLYDPTPGSYPKPDGTPLRYAKLLIGWITFGLFWLAVGVVGWYVVSLLLLITLVLFGLAAHTKGLRHLFHCVLEWITGGRM